LAAHFADAGRVNRLTSVPSGTAASATPYWAARTDEQGEGVVVALAAIDQVLQRLAQRDLVAFPGSREELRRQPA